MHMPWVHWPETMVTYVPEDRILFSCDLFGSHYASNDTFVSDPAGVKAAAKQYYAEIMMPFRSHIAKHLARLEGLEIAAIAPSHGPVYHEPELILSAYRDWALGGPKNLVAILYISMHGTTLKMVDHLVGELTEKAVPVQRFDVTTPELEKIAVALVDAATLVIGTPTVLGGPHPNILYAAYLANMLRPKAKFGAVLGPMLWGTKVVDRLAETIAGLKLELFDPVMCKGSPAAADYQALDALAAAIAAKHEEFRRTG
jgi:flavorubredoxin